MARLIFVNTITRNMKVKGDVTREQTRDIQTVAFFKGQKLYVRNILGDTVDDLAKVEELEDKHVLVTFNQDVLATVEGLHQNLFTCNNLRFVRTKRPYVKKSSAEVQQTSSASAESSEKDTKKKRRRSFHNHVTIFGRLNAACLHAGREPISIPGGLQYALAYRDDENGEGGEVIVAAPRRGVKLTDEIVGECCTGHIVRKDEIDTLLAGLPAKSSGSTQS